MTGHCFWSKHLESFKLNIYTLEFHKKNAGLPLRPGLWELVEYHTGNLEKKEKRTRKIRVKLNTFDPIRVPYSGPLSSTIRDSSRMRVCGFSSAMTRKCVYSCKPIWGGNLLLPPVKPAKSSVFLDGMRTCLKGVSRFSWPGLLLVLIPLLHYQAVVRRSLVKNSGFY